MSALIARVSLFLIALISCLFAYKYAVMYGTYPLLSEIEELKLLKPAVNAVRSYPLFVTIAYGAFLLILPVLVRSVTRKMHPGSRTRALRILTAFYLAFGAALVAATDQTSIPVDRWSVITSFWDAVHQQVFPYTARSHLNNVPGPLPFYFVLAYPFYLAGDIGYMSVAGCALLLVLVGKRFAGTEVGLSAVLLTVCSAAVLWETLARSTILTTSAVAVAYVTYAIGREHRRRTHWIVLGCLGGAVQSTRAVYALAFAACFAYKFLRKRRYVELLVVSISFVAALVLTFVPVALMNPSLFVAYNPITLQASFLGATTIAVFLVLSLLAGWFSRTDQELYFATGASIFAAVSTYLLREISTLGFATAIFHSAADISYLTLSLPFLLLALGPGSDCRRSRSETMKPAERLCGVLTQIKSQGPSA
jgi:hypothetical protein